MGSMTCGVCTHALCFNAALLAAVTVVSPFSLFLLMLPCPDYMTR